MNKTMYHGVEVSEEGKRIGRVDYRTLAKVVGDMVLCNKMAHRLFNTMDIENGSFNRYFDEEHNETSYEEYDELSGSYEESIDIFQWYIISDSGANFLHQNTDEVLFYDHELDVYVWGITHWGTSWDYVMTDIKLEDE